MVGSNYIIRQLRRKMCVGNGKYVLQRVPALFTLGAVFPRLIATYITSLLHEVMDSRFLWSRV